MGTDLSFKREHRLLHKYEFTSVFDDATRIVVPPFTLLFRENRSEFARLGLVIGKKALKRSVDRNRIRRIVRESFRLSRASLPRVDLIILARRDIESFPVTDLSHKVSKLWHRLGHD